MKQVDNTWKLSCKLILFEGTEAVLNDCLIWQYFGDFLIEKIRMALGLPTCVYGNFLVIHERCILHVLTRKYYQS